MGRGLSGFPYYMHDWREVLSGLLFYMQNGQEDSLNFSATCMIRGGLSGFMCYVQDGGGISGSPGYMWCDQILIGGSCENFLVFSVFSHFHNIKSIIVNHVKLPYILYI